LRESEKPAATAPVPPDGLLPIGEDRDGAAAGGPGGRASRATREGERFACLIRAYWQERGYGDVVTAVASVSRRSEGKAPVSAVRSNLVAGMPPGMAGRWRAPPPLPRGRQP
jgi:hypothetical protein